MTKAFNILTAGILLLATTAGNLTVFQCLIDGSFCLTESCCPAPESNLKEKSCCAHKCEKQETVEKESLLIKDDCCVEIDVEADFLNDIEMNIGTFEPIVISKLMSSPSLIPIFLTPQRSTVINDPPGIFLKSGQTYPIYKKLCTFLC